jgi:hypothetical protein
MNRDAGECKTFFLKYYHVFINVSQDDALFEGQPGNVEQAVND